MSEQLTSQSRSNESGITRRTALRGAAWSASAVTVVVATPNIAAATVTGTASGSATRSKGTATATATLVNGSAAIAANKLEVTIVGGTLATPPAGWTRATAGSTTRFLYAGTVEANGAAVFRVEASSPINLENSGQAYTFRLDFRVGALLLDSLTFNFPTQSGTVTGV